MGLDTDYFHEDFLRGSYCRRCCNTRFVLRSDAMCDNDAWESCPACTCSVCHLLLDSADNACDCVKVDELFWHFEDGEGLGCD